MKINNRLQASTSIKKFKKKLIKSEIHSFYKPYMKKIVILLCFYKLFYNYTMHSF